MDSSLVWTHHRLTEFYYTGGTLWARLDDGPFIEIEYSEDAGQVSVNERVSCVLGEEYWQEFPWREESHLAHMRCRRCVHFMRGEKLLW